MDVIMYTKNVEKRKRRTYQTNLEERHSKRNRGKKNGKEDVIRMGVVTKENKEIKVEKT